MATLDDSALDALRELNNLRDRAKTLRERGRNALAKIPEDITPEKYQQLKQDYDLSSDEWVSGPHPIDLALVLRVLNHRDLGEYEFSPPVQLPEILACTVTDLFCADGADDSVPILTAARAMHALVGRPQTVFSTATLLCYYRIVRELYLAEYPNWIIGAARAGEGGRVSAFITGECVRAIKAFQKAIRDTITFFKTTKKLCEEFERLKSVPNVDDYLKVNSADGASHWQDCLEIEFERVVLDWYAANDLRHNVIALDLSPIEKPQGMNGGEAKTSSQKAPSQDYQKIFKHKDKSTEPVEHSLLPSVFPLCGMEKINRIAVEKILSDLPNLLETAIEHALNNIAGAKDIIEKFREKEKCLLEDSTSKDVDPRRRFDVTASAHDLALRVVSEAHDEAKNAAQAMRDFKGKPDFRALLDRFSNQFLHIHQRIHRVIGPAKRYIQDVLNGELALAANSARFDAGELLFAAACFGALNGWKQNEQLAEARRLVTKLLPEDGRLQTSRPFQSTAKGLRLIPIAFEMTRCLAQLLQKDVTEDLDPKTVRKILNAFEEHPIPLSPGDNERIGWNFRGAPESQKPSVWVTALAVFALDRTVRMLNERINAMVLRNFNVEWPSTEVESLTGLAPSSRGKLDLNGLIYSDYELQSAFAPSVDHQNAYLEDPHRVDRVSIAVRLQQMRAHLTRAPLPNFYSKKSQQSEYKKAYSAIFYGPPGTGKTTLAEALATTARVPLVRLSPSDLMVQGTDVIESRARAIFDSLSMLTQVVIFLDEFEPVVRTRREPGKTPIDVPPDPPEFRFLVTGMLPKLIKLNKVAEIQSVVYCLATNYLIQIDKAAKRIGRFDLQIPIYHPDPMSRVGVFLYRLITILQKNGGELWRQKLKELMDNPSFWARAHEAIEKTAEVSAQSLATIFFSTKTSKSFFSYVLGDSPDCPLPTPEMSNGDHRTAVEQDIETQRSKYEDSWQRRAFGKPKGFGTA